MRLRCDYCDEITMDLEEGKEMLPDGNIIDILVMRCHNPECGVHEPLEADDFFGIVHQMIGEKTEADSLKKAMQIIYREMHLKDVTE